MGRGGRPTSAACAAHESRNHLEGIFLCEPLRRELGSDALSGAMKQVWAVLGLRREVCPDKTPDSSFVKETPKRWSSSFSQLASSFRKSKSRTVADASSFVRRLKGVAAEGSRHGMNLFSALGSTLATSSATTSRADMAKEGLSSTCSSEDGSLNVGDECEAEAALSA